ncbi:MAG TPA: 30S ribosomal protein S8 [Terriglobales bacterium]|nr:30S ribosomal protein S8 [Terriglobales bacterium]
MTDPIADLLTRIRNAGRARKEQVDVPYSTIKQSIVELLIAEGYLRDFTIVEQEGHKQLRVSLKYDQRNLSVITGIKRASRPSLRVYVGSQDIPKVRSGLGVSIVSTPKGLLSDREARRQNVGGELICTVW